MEIHLLGMLNCLLFKENAPTIIL